MKFEIRYKFYKLIAWIIRIIKREKLVKCNVTITKTNGGITKVGFGKFPYFDKANKDEG